MSSLKKAPLAIVDRPLTALAPYPRNPRKNDGAVERMMAAIREFGFAVPILATADGTVIDGHLRLKAAARLGMETVPTILCDGWTEAQVKAFRLLANRSVAWAEWDLDLLKLEIGELQALDFDLALTGFEAGELEGFLGGNAGLTDEDAAPEPPAEPVTQAGDLWILGPHRLLCGDCTASANVARLLGYVRPGLMVTDPPYGVDFEGAKYNPRAKHWAGIQNDKAGGEALREFLTAALSAWLPHMDDQSSFYLWTAAMEEGAAAAAIRDSGLHIQSQVIWKKNCLVLGQADYQWMHENCWYAFWKGRKHKWFGERKQTTVWEIDKIANASYVHPNQKPVRLYSIPIENHTLPSDCLCDPFCGSGSSIIAAQSTGRICYAMDIDPVYVDVAVQRWQAFTGQAAVLESDGRTFADHANMKVCPNGAAGT